MLTLLIKHYLNIKKFEKKNTLMSKKYEIKNKTLNAFLEQVRERNLVKLIGKFEEKSCQIDRWAKSSDSQSDVM